ncbi:hypothetical protein D3C80_1592530 [compost metagenome]
MAGLVQADREDRRYRGGDDAARGDPGQQGPLAPVQRGAQRRHEDVQRPCQQLDHQQQRQHRRAQPEQGVQVEARGQQDEQAGDQQHAEVLLEVQDLPHIHPAHVGQPHAHQRHRQQP